jgi:hypothetical protein
MHVVFVGEICGIKEGRKMLVFRQAEGVESCATNDSVHWGDEGRDPLVRLRERCRRMI